MEDEMDMFSSIRNVIDQHLQQLNQLSYSACALLQL